MFLLKPESRPTAAVTGLGFCPNEEENSLSLFVVTSTALMSFPHLLARKDKILRTQLALNDYDGCARNCRCVGAWVRGCWGGGTGGGGRTTTTHVRGTAGATKIETAEWLYTYW